MSEERRLVKSVEITDSGIHILQMGSVMDASTVPELEEVLNYLLSQNHIHFIVDLSHVEFVSSAGWGVFVGELKKIREAGGDIKLACMQPEVLDVFMLLELDQLIEAFSTVEEGIASFLKNMPKARQAVVVPQTKDMRKSGEPSENRAPDEAQDKTPAADAPPVAPEAEGTPDSPPSHATALQADTEAEKIAQRERVIYDGQPSNGKQNSIRADFNGTEMRIDAVKSEAEANASLEETQELPMASDNAGVLPVEDVQKDGDLQMDLELGPEAADESANEWSEEPFTAGALASDIDPEFTPEEVAEHPSILEAPESPAATAQPDESASLLSETPEPPLLKEPEPSPQKTEPDRLENPFDIAEIDDPWLGDMEVEPDDSKLRSRLSEGMIDDIDLNALDFQQEIGGLDDGSSTNRNDCDPPDNWEATEDDYENLQWLKKDAESLFETHENNSLQHTNRLPEHSSGKSRQSADEDSLMDQIISVVIANPNYGPSAIRKVLLEMNLIDPSVTRSMIFKKLIQLGLTTRGKREAFAKNHSLD